MSEENNLTNEKFSIEEFRKALKKSEKNANELSKLLKNQFGLSQNIRNIILK